MEANMLFGLVAVGTAFGCLFAAAFAGSASLARRRSAMVAQGGQAGVSGLLNWRLRNGFSCTMPIAQRLNKLRKVAAMANESVMACSARGLDATCDSVVSVAIIALIAAAIVVVLVTGNPIASVAVCACLVVIAHVVSGSARDKRREAIREAVPGALESMAACFGSGFTLLQTFTQVAQDTPGHFGATFERGAHILETGGSVQRALAELRKDDNSSDLAFVAIALDVQHQSGGSMRQVLEAAGDSVKSELDLRRSLRVQTAQARLSARVVVVMPFILVALFSIVSPDFLSPFFSSVFGYALLALAIVMQVAGVVLVNRALAVEGVS